MQLGKQVYLLRDQSKLRALKESQVAENTTLNTHAPLEQFFLKFKSTQKSPDAAAVTPP